MDTPSHELFDEIVSRLERSLARLAFQFSSESLIGKRRGNFWVDSCQDMQQQVKLVLLELISDGYVRPGDVEGKIINLIRFKLTNYKKRESKSLEEIKLRNQDEIRDERISVMEPDIFCRNILFHLMRELTPLESLILKERLNMDSGSWESYMRSNKKIVTNDTPDCNIISENTFVSPRTVNRVFQNIRTKLEHLLKE